MARIGIIGTGWGARVQVPAFRAAGLEVVAIAGSRREKTGRIAEELGVEPFDSWRELIASPVDVVTIVTPPSTHLEIARAALEAGRHVVSEKPTARDAAEAEELLRIASSRPDQIALIDHELRFLPSWRAARERIASDIGELRYAEVRYASPARGDRSREWTWWSDASQGGGVWGAVGSHFVDALRYFGYEVEAAQGFMRTTIAERPDADGAMRPVTSDDFASVQLRLRGGAVAAMTYSVVSGGPDDASVLTIHGERGAMRFIGEEVLLSRNRQPFTRILGDAMPELPGNSPGGAFGSGTIHLGRALRSALDDGDRAALAPGATFHDGLMQQRVLDAARRSSENAGRWETI